MWTSLAICLLSEPLEDGAKGVLGALNGAEHGDFQILIPVSVVRWFPRQWLVPSLAGVVAALLCAADDSLWQRLKSATPAAGDIHSEACGSQSQGLSYLSAFFDNL